MEIQLTNISHIIQLAIAPVFLLTGVGTKLSVLTSRLSRVIDRSRALQERIRQNPKENDAVVNDELKTLARRAHLINRAITLSTVCGLLICLVIVALFVGAALHLDFAKTIALLFVLSMLSLIGSFTCFLREIFVAIDSMSRHAYFGK